MTFYSKVIKEYLKKLSKSPYQHKKQRAIKIRKILKNTHDEKLGETLGLKLKKLKEVKDSCETF